MGVRAGAILLSDAWLVKRPCLNPSPSSSILWTFHVDQHVRRQVTGTGTRVMIARAGTSRKKNGR
jgi:hypothetical protein